IEAMAECAAVCEHAHLPLQSGSTRILKAMRRTYSRERYRKLVDDLRAGIPDLALTTDIIVGFPGETEDDFRETIEVVEEVGFDGAFTFVYSPRAGTDAAAMQEQVPDDVKRDRSERSPSAAGSSGSQRLQTRYAKTASTAAASEIPHHERANGSNASTAPAPASGSVRRVNA